MLLSGSDPLIDAIEPPRGVSLRDVDLHHRVFFDVGDVGILCERQRFFLGHLHAETLQGVRPDRLRHAAASAQQRLGLAAGADLIAVSVLIEHDDVLIRNRAVGLPV